MRELIITEITIMVCGIHEYKHTVCGSREDKHMVFMDVNTLNDLSDNELLKKYKEVVTYVASLK